MGQGAVTPRRGISRRSGKNFVSVEEFSTKNCVQMHKKIPSILIFSPPVGEPTPVGQILAPSMSLVFIFRLILQDGLPSEDANVTPEDKNGPLKVSENAGLRSSFFLIICQLHLFFLRTTFIKNTRLRLSQRIRTT